MHHAGKKFLEEVEMQEFICNAISLVVHVLCETNHHNLSGTISLLLFILSPILPQERLPYYVSTAELQCIQVT